MNHFILGPCSDCGLEMTTGRLGTDNIRRGSVYSGAPMDKVFGSVFLVCDKCAAKRADNGDWQPVKRHDPKFIIPHNVRNELSKPV